MAGTSDTEPKLTGFKKHFNSVTRDGRANVALFTLSSVALLGVYFAFKPKSKKADQ